MCKIAVDLSVKQHEIQFVQAEILQQNPESVQCMLNIQTPPKVYYSCVLVTYLHFVIDIDTDFRQQAYRMKSCKEYLLKLGESI